MVINGIIDISFTAMVGKMSTVAFIGDVPLYRPLSLKKLKYTLSRYVPDVLVLWIQGTLHLPDELFSVYQPIVIMGYDYDLLKKYYPMVDSVVWLIPHDADLIDDISNMTFRVEENIFLKYRKWFVGKEKRVEVVSSTLDSIFNVHGEILYRKFWL